MPFRMRLARNGLIRSLGSISKRCWACWVLHLLACYLLYCLCGGTFVFIISCFTITCALYYVQDHLLYHPDQPSHSRAYVPAPSAYNLPYESSFIKSEDGTMLHVYFISQPQDKMKQAPTLLFFHGNAGNIGHRLQNVLELYRNIQCNILILEYRGYGLSEGLPSEKGLYMDACAAINYLVSRTDINTNEIIVFGRSLGGAVAIDLITKPENSQKTWCLILENTFTSIPDMVSAFFKSKCLWYLPLFIYKNKYLSILKVRSVTVPTLFISGLADTLVPPHMMQDLYKNCRSSWKKILQVPGGTHSKTWCQPGYYQSICSFLNELRENPPMRVTSSHWQMSDI